MTDEFVNAFGFLFKTDCGCVIDVVKFQFQLLIHPGLGLALHWIGKGGTQQKAMLTFALV